MLGEVIDALAQERDLHLWGSGVRVVCFVRSDDFRLSILRKRHAVPPRTAQRTGTRSLPLQPAVAAPCRAITIPSDSIFYTRTTTGCKSPPASGSAMPIRWPEASSNRQRARAALTTGGDVSS